MRYCDLVHRVFPFFPFFSLFFWGRKKNFVSCRENESLFWPIPKQIVRWSYSFNRSGDVCRYRKCATWVSVCYMQKRFATCRNGSLHAETSAAYSLPLYPALCPRKCATWQKPAHSQTAASRFALTCSKALCSICCMSYLTNGQS